MSIKLEDIDIHILNTKQNIESRKAKQGEIEAWYISDSSSWSSTPHPEGVCISASIGKWDIEITLSAEDLKDLLRLIPSENVVSKAEAPDHGLRRME